MLSAITGLLSALPSLVSLMTNIYQTLVKLSGGDIAGYVNRLGTAFAQLNTAQTEADHANAAKAIADAISGQPAK
jgi:hypothetical protein